MAFIIIGIMVFAALTVGGFLWLETREMERRERIARAVRPVRGGPIVPPAPVRNRLGED